MEPALVGRDRELEALRGVLAAVRRRKEGRIAIVEGEVGIGKTRLLAEALAGEGAAEFEVVRAGADELGSEQPFGLVAEAFDLGPDSRDSDAAELGRLIARPSAASPSLDAPDVRFRVVESLLALIERLAYQRPLALALEDLHWADPSTLLTLHRLMRRFPHVPVALFGTCRPRPHPAELAAILDEVPEWGVHVVLPPLDAGDARSLGAALLDAEPGPGLATQISGAEGNPLFVVELIGALRDEGSIERIDGRADVRDAGLPPTLSLTILRRLSFLRADVLDMLRAASVLGASFSVADLALVLERPIPELVPLLREAIDPGVLREEGDRLRFRHDLVRECLYEDLALPLRAGLHLQAARALESAGRPAAQVATHFAIGAPAGDGQAVECLRQAAGETASRAPGVAARFLRRAVELLPEDAADRGVLRVDLARALLWAGELAEAESLARELLAQTPEPRDATALHYALGRTLAYQGRLEDSIKHIERVLDHSSVSGVDRARLRAELAHRHLLSGDIPAAEGAAQEAGAQDDRVARWTALCALAWVAAARGELEPANDLADEAVATADSRTGDPVERIQPRLYSAFVRAQLDRLDEADRLLREGLTVAEELGASWALPLQHAGLAVVHWHSGGWDDALAEAETSLALGDELDVRVWKPLAHGVIASIAFSRDDFGRVQSVLRDAAAEPAGRSARFFADRLVIAESLLAEAAGDGERAIELLADHWRSLRERGSLGEWREMAPHLVRLALAAGDVELAREVTATADSAAATSRVAAAAGVALLCRGILERDGAVLLRAGEALRGSPRPLESALAAEAAALSLDARERERAADLLREALASYERLGAARDASRAKAELRRRGVRRGARGVRKRAEEGWESLTPSEQRISALVAEGLTNPQIGERLFLSPRTVEQHVSHALRKLGFSSRTQLAAEAVRQQASPAPAPRTGP